MPSTSVKSLEKFYEGLFAVGLIENAPIESEGTTMIFADAQQPHSRRSFRKVLMSHEWCSSLQDMHFDTSENAFCSYLSSIFSDCLS